MSHAPAVRRPWGMKRVKCLGIAGQKARAERAERCALSADWVVDELRKIAGIGTNMADYLKSTTHGDPYRDFFGTDA
jgi:hypothetical protein